MEFPRGVRMVADPDRSDLAPAVNEDNLRRRFDLELAGDGEPSLDGEGIWDSLLPCKICQHAPLPLGGDMVVRAPWVACGLVVQVVVIPSHPDDHQASIGELFMPRP